MKRSLFSLLLLVPLFFAEVRAQEPVNGERHVIDDIAAVVGGEIILSSEIKMAVLQVAQARKIALTDTTALRVLSEELLEDAIAEKVLLHQAKEAKVEVSAEELNQLVESQLNELRNSYRSDEEFQRSLAEGGQTMVSLQEFYRESARERLMGQTFLRNNSQDIPRVKVEEEEARKLFEAQPGRSTRPEQIKFMHMLIAPKPGEDMLDQARARIDSVYKLYTAGADFAELAGTNSDCPSSSRGGDLGFFSRGEMVKEFEDAAFQMKVGEVRIVKSSFGWHLIKVEARRQKEVRTRHILAQTQVREEDWLSARELAESLRRKVLEGGSFFELAREHGEESKDLLENPPLVDLQQLQPFVRQALSSGLTPVPGTGYMISEVSELRPRGYILVLRMEHREAAPLTFEDVREQLIQSLQQQKSIEAYIEKLREKTYVDVRFKDWNPQGVL